MLEKESERRKICKLIEKCNDGGLETYKALIESLYAPTISLINIGIPLEFISKLNTVPKDPYEGMPLFCEQWALPIQVQAYPNSRFQENRRSVLSWFLRDAERIIAAIEKHKFAPQQIMDITSLGNNSIAPIRFFLDKIELYKKYGISKLNQIIEFSKTSDKSVKVFQIFGKHQDKCLKALDIFHYDLDSFKPILKIAADNFIYSFREKIKNRKECCSYCFQNLTIDFLKEVYFKGSDVGAKMQKIYTAIALYLEEDNSASRINILSDDVVRKVHL